MPFIPPIPPCKPSPALRLDPPCHWLASKSRSSKRNCFGSSHVPKWFVISALVIVISVLVIVSIICIICITISHHQRHHIWWINLISSSYGQLKNVGACNHYEVWRSWFWRGNRQMGLILDFNLKCGTLSFYRSHYCNLNLNKCWWKILAFDNTLAMNMFLFRSSSWQCAGTDNRPPMNVVLIYVIFIRQALQVSDWMTQPLIKPPDSTYHKTSLLAPGSQYFSQFSSFVFSWIRHNLNPPT